MAKQMVLTVSTGMTFSQREVLLGFTVEEWRALSGDEQSVEIDHAIKNIIDWSVKVED
ncbi:hypothetical protein AB6H27_22800 [Providencia huaxiensis]|uniref:DUF7167 family protein n=1 Tax=Providencia TaxID=586 RepID=UPI0018C511D8|nr:hypothetical protein [Providencia stuartii]MBG5919005.1 hypothetical protein [Providencia stuartii]